MTGPTIWVVEEVARDFLLPVGARAAPFLRELAEVADGINDKYSAEAWRGIAMCAADLIERPD